MPEGNQHEGRKPPGQGTDASSLLRGEVTWGHLQKLFSCFSKNFSAFLSPARGARELHAIAKSLFEKQDCFDPSSQGVKFVL